MFVKHKCNQQEQCPKLSKISSIKSHSQGHKVIDLSVTKNITKNAHVKYQHPTSYCSKVIMAKVIFDIDNYVGRSL